MKKQNGQTLVEVLVALGVAVIIITAIAVLVTSALSNNQFIKNQNLATAYANQGIEFVRQLRGVNYSSLLTYPDIYYCLDQKPALSKRIGSNCPQNVGIFVREVDIEPEKECPKELTRVTALVSWADNKCTSTSNPYCHQVKLVSCLSTKSIIEAP